ncbi:CoA-binding protein [Paenibacillus protaetiae]|uniref:CoA-binding protein n=1 Tax=Paenibacillus protaetiae TaxID=2509456 RepID=A0A4P6ESE0_9BACL|nr:CoA-binding protein [Paenibacillus protaetiae]QAY65476.1 CoA-binding protein [Paenibacillus protaetiae]
MAFENPPRDQIRELLKASSVIAVVGLSDNPDRTSHMIAKAMQQKGYRIIPVNPGASSILGERCYGTLAEIPFKVDIVNVFRRSEFTPDIARQAVAIRAKALWLQLGVVNETAARVARAGGLTVIMDRCIKVEDSILLPNGKGRN